jgi:uncharacterized protein (TIGR03067 family)
LNVLPTENKGVRRATFLLVTLLVLPEFGSDSPNESVSPETIGIEGTWRRTEFVLFGKRIELPYETVLVLSAGTFTRKDSNGNTIEGTFRIDSSKIPAQIDWMYTSGSGKRQTVRSIYQLDGDTLREAGLPGVSYEEPPVGFKDKGIEVIAYKRVR